jgi:hypothetical protein
LVVRFLNLPKKKYKFYEKGFDAYFLSSSVYQMRKIIRQTLNY